MAIALVGLNFRTAPVDLREKLALSGDALAQALAALRNWRDAPHNGEQRLAPDEVAIVSTCNRLEIYIAAPHARQTAAAALAHIARLNQLSPHELDGHMYEFSGDSAVKHLMRVACGLESMILGETQILGQVTQAFEDARAAGATGPILSHLFAQAIHCGKRAHSETLISRRATSVSSAGVRALLEALPHAESRRFLVVGAGEMATLAAQAVYRLGRADLRIVNRTYAHAQALATNFNATPLAWHQLVEGLAWADAVVSATSAPHTVIHRSDLDAALPQRGGRPLAILDIAVPRDVEDSVRALPEIRYLDIDDLQSVVDANVEQRAAAIPAVEAIIDVEMARFCEWYHGRQVAPVIKTLREWAEGIAADELDQTLNRLSSADERTRQLVSRLAHRLVNRLLHEPTSRLRLQASEGNGTGYAHAVRELFALNELDAFECSTEDERCAYQPAGEAAPVQCNLRCILPPVVDHRS